MDSLRLIPIETYDAYMNMAIDEAVFRAKIQSLVPNTLRFYRWKPSAVSVGRFQKVDLEVFMENCRKHSVNVVRRITGGGAVYHDSEGEITYGVVADRTLLGTEDVELVYRKICKGLVEALKRLGLRADFKPWNPRQCPNITVNGRKISGSAQLKKGGVVLQHGTFLLDVDLEKMFDFLRFTQRRTSTEIAQTARKKVTSLKHELGRKPSVDEVYHALIEGFQQALDVELKEGDLTASELDDAKRLSKEKISTTRWTFQGEE